MEFCGEGYLADGLFVWNTIFAARTSSSTTFACIAKSVNLWHGRLGHVNIASIRRLKTMHLINVANNENCTKCSVCVEAKYEEKKSLLDLSKQEVLCHAPKPTLGA